jgi:hypothetical protein
MRPGGGKNKGSAFERAVCRKLSLWVTDGVRNDVFARNVTSGGQFTTARKKGEVCGQPGDIMARAEEGNALINNFLIECKHYHDLHFTTFFNRIDGNNNLLQKFASRCAKEATELNKSWLLITKQDRRQPLIIMPYCFVNYIDPLQYWVILWGEYLVVDFDEFISTINPTTIIETVHQCVRPRLWPKPVRKRLPNT